MRSRLATSTPFSSSIAISFSKAGILTTTPFRLSWLHCHAKFRLELNAKRFSYLQSPTYGLIMPPWKRTTAWHVHINSQQSYPYLRHPTEYLVRLRHHFVFA